MKKVKVFWSGRSQIVRLPEGFRFHTTEIRIRKHGNTVILEPVAEDWTWLDTVAGELDDDFVQAVNEQPNKNKELDLKHYHGWNNWAQLLRQVRSDVLVWQGYDEVDGRWTSIGEFIAQNEALAER